MTIVDVDEMFEGEVVLEVPDTEAYVPPEDARGVRRRRRPLREVAPLYDTVALDVGLRTL